MQNETPVPKKKTQCPCVKTLDMQEIISIVKTLINKYISEQNILLCVIITTYFMRRN